MKLTALTCTFERPEAFCLCEKYVRRQTRQPDQWLVLDGPEPMQEKLARAIADNRIEGDALLFTEDDDWFSPDWFEWCGAQLERGYDIVGEGQAIFYNVNHRWWNNCGNVRHASLCETAISRTLLASAYNIASDFGCPWIDVQLWNIDCNRRLRLPGEGRRRVVGIKGMPGTKGYSREHRMVNGSGDDNTPDYNLSRLYELIGEDSLAYAGYFAGEDELMRLAGAFPT